jgi:predicted RNase H-like HicB family nuclease
MARSEEVTTLEYNFTAVFEPAEEGGYVVTFPAIPNLATQGETLEEARAMAEDCLRCYLEGLQKDGLPLPESEEYQAEPIRSGVTVKLQAV